MKNFREKMDEKKYEFTKEKLEEMLLLFSALLYTKIMFAAGMGEQFDRRDVEKLVDEFIEKQIKNKA